MKLRTRIFSLAVLLLFFSRNIRGAQVVEPSFAQASQSSVHS